MKSLKIESSLKPPFLKIKLRYLFVITFLFIGYNLISEQKVFIESLRARIVQMETRNKELSYRVEMLEIEALETQLHTAYKETNHNKFN